MECFATGLIVFLFPLIAGVLIIFPLIIFSFTFSKAAIMGAPNAWQQAVQVITSGSFVPFRTAHLWFIYYLFMFSLLGWFIDTLFNKVPDVRDRVDALFKKIVLSFWLRLICSNLLTFLCLYWMGSALLKTNNTFDIDLTVFVTYFMFYGMGWMLYRADCLKQLSNHCWLQLGIATLLFLISMFVPWPNEPWVLLVKQVITALYTPLFVVGFIALFLTYFSNYSPRLSYLMEASYWVYIIHLPIAALIPGLIAGFALPAMVKFLIVFSITTLICFVSYHYLVRSYFIGKFLNGKTFKPKKSFSELVAVE